MTCIFTKIKELTEITTQEIKQKGIYGYAMITLMFDNVEKVFGKNINQDLENQIIMRLCDNLERNNIRLSI